MRGLTCNFSLNQPGPWVLSLKSQGWVGAMGAVPGATHVPHGTFSHATQRLLIT